MIEGGVIDMANFCGNCGAKLDDQAKFCPVCGKSLTIKADTDEPEKNIGQSQLPDISAETEIEKQMDSSIPAEFQKEEGLKEKFLSFKGRLNRKRYFLRQLALGLFSGIFISFLSGMMTNTKSLDMLIVFVVLILAIAIPCIACGVSLMVRRFHDLGKSGWYILWNLCPVINIGVSLYLLFGKGVSGENSYGPDPLER